MSNTVFDFWLMSMQDSAGELGPTLGNHTHNKIYSASFADCHRTCPVIVAEEVAGSPNEAGGLSESGEEEEGGASYQDCSSGEKLYILMLTNFMENGRPKCATYFPEQPGEVLCFYSGSGNDSQCEARSAEAVLEDDEDVPPTADEQTDDYRRWYEMAVRDPGPSDWKWVQSLRRSSRDDPALSESCFIVRNVGLREETGYSVRNLQVKYVNGRHRISYRFTVEHYWFPDWPDHKSPEDLSVVLDFALDLLRVPGLTMSLRTPDSGMSAGGSQGGAKVVLPILHCSAGIGRTGCMAGILNALRQLHCGPLQPQLLGSAASSSGASSSGGCLEKEGRATVVDILGIVCNLRLQRGGMVQNYIQYELIHRVLCLYQQKADEELGIYVPAPFL